MSDTVSATQFWSLGDVRMNFLAPPAGTPQPEVGNPHIAGGANSTYASPSLIVNFATATPDFQLPNLGVATAADPAPPTVSAYAAAGADNPQPVVIVGGLHTT